jgi:hypothetical protein
MPRSALVKPSAAWMMLSGKSAITCFAEPGQGIEPDPARRPPPHALERSARARDRSELLQRHVARTAHALYFAAADTAALLDRRADLLGQRGRIDYETEIKRLRVLADQARQMAERWEQP